MLEIFSLETDRLLIRPFVMDDLDAIYDILTEAFGEHDKAERKSWLEWTVRNYVELARLYQPPYGERAIVRKSDNVLVGSVGLVQSYMHFEVLPYFREQSTATMSKLSTPEMGLFWALGNDYRGQGYATEAAQAMIDYMFNSFGLKRIVATTEYDNEASIAVMKRLGMTIQHNPDQEPEWFQVVGILPHPNLR